MVVGDDAQAIYAFRAASIRNILDFPNQFPGARRITLEQNYRSTRPILDVSNAVIAYARERFPKDLWPVRSGGARPGPADLLRRVRAERRRSASRSSSTASRALRSASKPCCSAPATTATCSSSS